MVELLGSVGWGLLALGAITHTWHHRRLRELLAMHFDYERLPAVLLTSLEVGVAITLPILVLAQHGAVVWVSLAALVVALGFVLWIARLLVTGSELPCACSFSQAPTSVWSLGRSACATLVGLLAFSDSAPSTTEHLATMAVGWAVAAAVYVVPEAVSWPTASRALMARVDAVSTQP